MSSPSLIPYLSSRPPKPEVRRRRARRPAGSGRAAASTCPPPARYFSSAPASGSSNAVRGPATTIDVGVGRQIGLAEAVPGPDRHVVPLEELLGVGEAPPALAANRAAPRRAPCVKYDLRLPRLSVTAEDRRRERLLALERLDGRRAAAHAHPGEVEVGELVLLDVLLAVADAEDDRVLPDAELLDEGLGARQVAPRIEVLDLDLRAMRAW